MKEKIIKGILDNDVVISNENVKKIGEVIALTVIKTVIVRSGKELHFLYNGLLQDMNRSKDNYTPFSDAYDIAQESILFLCEHIGKKLGDSYITKYGKTITVRSACFRHTDRYLEKQYATHIQHTISLDERITGISETITDGDSGKDYAVVDILISKMKLTSVEYETLCAYMAGLTYLEITRLLRVNRTTIWRRKMRIQKKYIFATNGT